MLAIESMRDVVLVLEIANCPVGIVLHGCCENDYLKMLAKGAQELVCSRPYVEGSLVVKAWVGFGLLKRLNIVE